MPVVEEEFLPIAARNRSRSRRASRTAGMSGSASRRSITLIKGNFGLELLPQSLYFRELVVTRIMRMLHSKVEQTSVGRIYIEEVWPSVQTA
jgi:hypothetical protein